LWSRFRLGSIGDLQNNHGKRNAIYAQYTLSLCMTLY